MDTGILPNKGDAHNWITIVLFFNYENGVFFFRFLFVVVGKWPGKTGKKNYYDDISLHRASLHSLVSSGSFTLHPRDGETNEPVALPRRVA